MNCRRLCYACRRRDRSAHVFSDPNSFFMPGLLRKARFHLKKWLQMCLIGNQNIQQYIRVNRCNHGHLHAAHQGFHCRPLSGICWGMVTWPFRVTLGMIITSWKVLPQVLPVKEPSSTENVAPYLNTIWKYGGSRSWFSCSSIWRLFEMKWGAEQNPYPSSVSSRGEQLRLVGILLPWKIQIITPHVSVGGDPPIKTFRI